MFAVEKNLATFGQRICILPVVLPEHVYWYAGCGFTHELRASLSAVSPPEYVISATRVTSLLTFMLAATSSTNRLTRIHSLQSWLPDWLAQTLSDVSMITSRSVVQPAVTKWQRQETRPGSY